MNDDVRSPGSQSTPGPLSAQPPPGLDSDPGMSFKSFQKIYTHWINVEQFWSSDHDNLLTWNMHAIISIENSRLRN